MQIPYSKSVVIYPICIWFVWRRLEFAFLCADFGQRTFYYILEENMKKIVCLLIVISTLLFIFSSCKPSPDHNLPKSPSIEDNSSSNSTENQTFGNNLQNGVANQNSTLNKVIEMFIRYGSYDAKYNLYYFSKVDNYTGNVMINYQFIYHPSDSLFTASSSAHTYTSYEMIDYGSATFSWQDVKNAYCSGYHQFDTIANIDFSFSNIQLGTDLRLTDNFNYQVQENTFVNLKNHNEIKEYASTCFECVQFGLGYAQTVLFQYLGSSYTLW